jgi:DegT/DnrJ/EryC1/StrS aminotransferase family
MQVPFLDLRARNRSARSRVRAALDRVLDQARFIVGAAVERIETRFAAYVSSRHYVELNNGTSAFHLTPGSCAGVGDEFPTTPAIGINTSPATRYVSAPVGRNIKLFSRCLLNDVKPRGVRAFREAERLIRAARADCRMVPIDFDRAPRVAGTAGGARPALVAGAVRDVICCWWRLVVCRDR